MDLTPNYVVFLFNHGELKNLFEEQLKKDSALDSESLDKIQFWVYYDKDTYKTMTSLINESEVISKEEINKLPLYFHQDEYFLNAERIIGSVFNIPFPERNTYCYYYPDREKYVVEIDYNSYLPGGCRCSEDEVFGVIRWCRQDVEDALKNKGITPTRENVEAFINRHQNIKALEECSISTGWEIIDNLINMMQADGIFPFSELKKSGTE